jgi:type VII secretion protein EccB
MASKRDLVEAHDFNRRRLVTAFLSGAPGGREVEPVRYGRTIIGGLVLAALLVAGAAVAGVLKPAVGQDWRENGLVIGKQSGSRFLMFDEQLYPIANIASARLAINGELKISYVPDDILVKETKRDAIGIVNAPDYLPPPSSLVQSGWTACTNGEGGLRTVVNRSAGAAAATGQALVVQSSTDKRYWIVANGLRYLVPTTKNSRDVLLSLGLDRTDPFPASNDWLRLVATGSTVQSFSVPGLGSPKETSVDGLDVVGTPIRVDGKGYVLGRDGLIPLSDFAYAVYTVGPEGSRFPPVEVEAGQLSGLKTVTGADLYPSDWPTDRLAPYEGSTPCLVLASGRSASAVSRALLATPRDAAVVPRGGAVTVTVQQGSGALVYATTRRTGGPTDTEYLIDSLGSSYAIGPKAVRDQTQERLGYQDVTPVPVPRPWIGLFRDGPQLNIYKAGEPVA